MRGDLINPNLTCFRHFFQTVTIKNFKKQFPTISRRHFLLLPLKRREFTSRKTFEYLFMGLALGGDVIDLGRGEWGGNDAIYRWREFSKPTEK